MQHFALPLRRRLRSRSRRWIFRILLGGVGLAIALPAAWLLTHLRSRHDHFTERRGELTSASVQSDAPSANLAPGLISESVRVQSDSGLAVEFRVVRPENAPGLLPLVVLLGGHRTGRDAVELVGDPGSAAVAALNFPYDGPEKIRGVREGIATLPVIQQALLDTPPAVSLALDWLIKRSWVDPARVELVGVSLGTPFATVAGALDERFRRVWLLHGGADNRAWLHRTLERKIKHDTLRGGAASLLHLLAHGASFDTAEWVARIAPRPVVVVGAREDEALSRENVEALYEAAGEPRTLYWTEGGHVRPNRPEIVQQLLAIVWSQL